MKFLTLAELTIHAESLTNEHREVVNRAEAFCEMMTRTPIFARLCEQCGYYISRFSNEDREAVLAVALELAWSYSEEFDPTQRSLIGFWDACLRHVLFTRPAWGERTRHGVVMTPTLEISERMRILE